MELLHLKYFIRVAERNNISKAAAEFHVVSSAVSNHIKALEQELGAVSYTHLDVYKRQAVDGRHNGKSQHDEVAPVEGLD